MQISAETGQINPSYCPDSGGGATTEALEEALTGNDTQVLTTADGEAWIIGSAGEMAELYPTVALFTAPTTYPITSGPDAGDIGSGGYETYVAGNDVIVRAPTEAGPANVDAYDTTTHVWTELLGPQAAAQVPAGGWLQSVSYDSSDNATLLYGTYADGTSPWAFAFSQTTGAMTPLISQTLNAPPSGASGFSMAYVLYDPATDDLDYASYLGSPLSVAGPDDIPAVVNFESETINVATGATAAQAFELPDGTIWPPVMLPVVPGATILWPTWNWPATQYLGG